MYSSVRYRSFVLERDRVLERLLLKSQLRISDLLRRTITQVLTLSSNNYERLIHTPSHSTMLNHNINHLFMKLGDEITSEYQTLRRKVHVFTMAATTEGMARAMGKKMNYKVDAQRVYHHMTKDAASGGDLRLKIQHYTRRLANKVGEAITLGAVNGDDKEVFLQRIYRAFPKPQRVSSKRILKPAVVREADQRKIAQRMSFGFVTDEEWQSIVDDYKSDFIPEWRGPEYEFPVDPSGPVYTKADGEEVTYAWEVERDLTHDFVQGVRDGTNEAAAAQGITDMMWIAVLDNTTCDDCCWNFGCSDFDGLSLTEIEKLTKGEVTSCPAHFNCRCDLAPMTDDMPEAPPPPIGDFDEWLNSKW